MIARSMQRNGLILAAFACAATLLVVITARLTAEPIARQQQQELLQVLNQVIAPNEHDNDLYQSCIRVRHEQLGPPPQAVYRATMNGEPVAAAMEVTAPNGYSGAIKLLVAVYTDGSVAGVRTLQHQETPGLGDKIEIRKNDWITSFDGREVRAEDDPRWAVKRDGGQFDQFTGATITPRAVIQAVERAVRVFKQHQQDWFGQPANCTEPVPSTVPEKAEP